MSIPPIPFHDHKWAHCNTTLHTLHGNLLPIFIETSQSVLADKTKVLTLIIFILVILTGVLGNLVVIIVLAKAIRLCKYNPQLNTRKGGLSLLLSLATADSLFVIFCAPNKYLAYVWPDWPLGNFACKVNHFLINVFQFASCYFIAGDDL